MSLTSAAIDLSNAMESARIAWEEASAEWNDAVSRDFEANQFDPLANQARAVIQAMDRLAPVLARAARETA